MAEQVIEWVTDANTCFLIGAGCSACAGKPMIDDLTTRVVARLGSPAQSLFNGLVSPRGRPTIEDLLSQLIQIKHLLAGRREQKEGAWDISTIEDQIRTIQDEILKEIGGPWQSSPTHEKFLRRLATHRGRKYCDIFSLNYDLIFEATFESLQLAYTDGFRGADSAYFDLDLYKQEPERNPLFRYVKLHGSVNWTRANDNTVRRRPCREQAPEQPLVIYPSEQKFLATRYGVHEALLTLFRERLREPRANNKLVILGYSLADRHISEALLDAVNAPGSTLTIYVLLGAEQDLEAQILRLQSLVSRGDSRVNVMVGDQAFLGPALDESEWADIKDLNLWRFENLAALLAGGTE